MTWLKVQYLAEAFHVLKALSDTPLVRTVLLVLTVQDMMRIIVVGRFFSTSQTIARTMTTYRIYQENPTGMVNYLGSLYISQRSEEESQSALDTTERTDCLL